MEAQQMIRMYLITMVIVFNCFLGTPTATSASPIWYNTFDSVDYPATFTQRDRDLYAHILPYLANPGIFEDYAERRYNKRGFSMLARWKPFNMIGKQRSSIRDAPRVPAGDLDIVSAETRAFSRPMGQPLRWG